MAKKTKTPAAAPVPTISQAKIAALYAKMAEHEDAKAKARSLEKERESLEAEVLGLLKGNAAVEPGSFVASIARAPGRFSFSWKDGFLGLKAKYENKTPAVAEEEVRTANPPKMVESLQITKLG